MAFGNINNRGKKRFGASRNGTYGALPLDRTYDLEGENYCFMQDPRYTSIEEQFKQVKDQFLADPSLTGFGGGNSFGGGTNSPGGYTLPITRKAAIIIWQVGGPCDQPSTVVPNPPDPYGGYPPGRNWGYRDSQGVEHQYPEQFATLRGDGYGAQAKHKPEALSQLQKNLTETINRSFFDGVYVEGLAGGDVDIYYQGDQTSTTLPNQFPGNPGEWTLPATGLACYDDEYPSMCNNVSTRTYIRDTLNNDPRFNQDNYDSVFHIIVGCWAWSAYTAGTYQYAGSGGGNRVDYHVWLSPWSWKFGVPATPLPEEWTDPDGPLFQKHYWEPLGTSTWELPYGGSVELPSMVSPNSGAIAVNDSIIAALLHEFGHKPVYEGLGGAVPGSWAHDKNVGLASGYYTNPAGTVCPCEFSDLCPSPGIYGSLTVGAGTVTGPDSPDCYSPIGTNYYGPNGLNPYNVMNYSCAFSDKLRPGNWRKLNDGSGRTIKCRMNPDVCQGAVNGIVGPSLIYELPANGTDPWEGEEEIWLMAHDYHHIVQDPNQTFYNNALFGPGQPSLKNLVIRTPMSLDIELSPNKQHLYLSFHSRDFCAPSVIQGSPIINPLEPAFYIGDYGGHIFDDPDNVKDGGALLVSWGPSEYVPSNPSLAWTFNKVPAYMVKRLPKSNENNFPIGLTINSFPTVNSVGDPSYFPGWDIKVIDEIVDPGSFLRLAIKLRIKSLP